MTREVPRNRSVFGMEKTNLYQDEFEKLFAAEEPISRFKCDSADKYRDHVITETEMEALRTIRFIGKEHRALYDMSFSWHKIHCPGEDEILKFPRRLVPVGDVA